MVKDAKEIYAEFKSASAKMEKGEIEGLDELKELFDKGDLMALTSASDLLTERQLLMVWITSKMIDDLWTNFGPDSSGFHLDDGDHFTKVIKFLGKAIKESLVINDGLTIIYLSQSNGELIRLLQKTDRRLLDDGPIPEEKAFRL